MLFATCCRGSEHFEENIMDDRAPVSIYDGAPCSTSGSGLSRGSKKPKSRAMEKRQRSSEDETVEKARLQSLVDSFAKKAVRGCPCTHLDDRRGERTEALYRIDKSLRHLTLLAKDDRRVIAECPIQEIQDIYLLDDGEECFPPDVVKRLKPHERELLLMVVHGSSQTKVFSFCMMEESRESRDKFLESLRVLSIYAVHAPAQDRNHLSPGGRPVR